MSFCGFSVNLGVSYMCSKNVGKIARLFFKYYIIRLFLLNFYTCIIVYIIIIEFSKTWNRHLSMTTFFFSHEAKSVPGIRFHREELSTQTLSYPKKNKGWTLFGLIRTSPRKRNDVEILKQKISDIGHAQRNVISKRPTLGVMVKNLVMSKNKDWTHLRDSKPYLV